MWQWNVIKAFREGLYSFTSVTDVILTEIFKNWIFKIQNSKFKKWTLPLQKQRQILKFWSETVIEGRTVELRANLVN